MMDQRDRVRFFSFAGLAAGLLLPLRLHAEPADSTGLRGAAPSTPTAALKNDGEIGAYTSTGTFKGKLPVGKIDPPAAFNLGGHSKFSGRTAAPRAEQPRQLLEEGRDFSDLLRFSRRAAVPSLDPRLFQERLF